MCWLGALTQVIVTLELHIPMVTEAGKRGGGDSLPSSEHFCLFWHSLLLLTFHWPQKITFTWLHLISYLVHGRQGTGTIWRIAPIAQDYGRVSTASMSKCLVHSGSHTYASSLQRNIAILWNPSLPAPLFARRHQHWRLFSLGTQEGKKPGQYSSSRWRVITWIIGKDLLAIFWPRHIKTSAAAEAAAATEPVFIDMALTIRQALFKGLHYAFTPHNIYLR